MNKSKLLLASSLLILLSACSSIPTYSPDDVVCEKGLCVDKNKQPVTGILKFSENDSKIEIPVTNGKIHGTSYVKSNGLKEEISYVNGILDGRYYAELNDDKLLIPFKNNKVEGNVIYFTKITEDEVFEVPYKNNKPVDGKIYGYCGEDERVCMELTIKNGKPEGYTKKLIDNKNLLCDCNYNNGKINGKMRIFADNGNLYKDFNFKDGKLNGISNTYSSNDGDLLSTVHYKDNKAVKGTLELINGKNKPMTDAQLYSYEADDTYFYRICPGYRFELVNSLVNEKKETYLIKK